MRLLKNAQDCYNSFNSGRTEDPLETVTNRPTEFVSGECVDEIEGEQNHIEQIEEQYVETMNHIFNPEQIKFKDNNGKLVVDTSIVRLKGSHKCGQTLLCKPSFTNSNAIACAIENSTNKETNVSDSSSNTSRC